MMTKKDFIALADALREQTPRYAGTDRDKMLELGYWYKMCERLADFCKNQNRHFKRERWLAYLRGECGPNGGKLKTKTP